jgi:hypothetical protein
MHMATVLADGRVLVAGGSTGGTTSLASVEIYDPVANSWSSGGTLGIARRQHTATTLSDGRVVIIGGVANAGAASITSAEIYNSQTNTWSAAAALATARSAHTATLLTDNTGRLRRFRSSGKGRGVWLGHDYLDEASVSAPECPARLFAARSAVITTSRSRATRSCPPQARSLGPSRRSASLIRSAVSPL